MKRYIPFVLIIVVLSAFLISCGSGGENSNAIMLYDVENLSEYVVVRGEKCSEEETELVTSLRKAINDATGASVGLKTDFYNNNYEILVGNTKRPQSFKAMEGLRYNDYTIKMEGNKIVIVGGSTSALSEAVELFKNQFIFADQKTVKMPSGEGYSYKHDYLFDKLSVEGVDITDFSVVNRSFSDTDEFTYLLSSFVGSEMKAHEGELVDGEHYIILDGSELISDKYSITVENGNITIKGSAHSLTKAIEIFSGDFFEGVNSRSFDLTSAKNCEGSVGKKDIYTKEQLLAVIDQVYADKDHIIIGEQVCGNPKSYDSVEKSIELFEKATGEIPGIIGIDLAYYGLDLTNTDDYTWSEQICDLVDFAADGGIITASAHWANPSGNTMGSDPMRGKLGYTDTIEGYEQAFTDVITEGTEYNTALKNELEVNVRFFKLLAENGVSIIFRPLHEANGDWFWYCAGVWKGFLDSSYVIDLWRYVYDYITVECGVNNLIWCYAPNMSANNNNDPSESVMGTIYLYPGDNYCDMVGVDWYTGGGIEIADGKGYLNLVDHSGKPGAITEFGTNEDFTTEDVKDQPSLYSSMDLYDNLKRLNKEGHSFVYLITWYNRYDITSLGRGDEFMKTEMTLGQNEVKALFGALK